MGARHGHNYAKDATLTEEGTGGEYGDDQRLVRGGEKEARGVRGAHCRWLTEFPKPVVHLDDTGDGTGVVTEKDTTKGGEGGHGNASDLALCAGGTNAPACSDWTTRHGERVECGG